MAALTNSEKQKLRRRMEDKANSLGAAVRWNKPAIHAVMQAVEDRMTTDLIGSGNQARTIAALVSESINTAAALHGLTFTAAEKKFIVAFWASTKFERDK